MQAWRENTVMAGIHVLSVKALESHHLEKLRQVSPRLHVSQKTCDDPTRIPSLLRGIDMLYTLDASFSLGRHLDEMQRDQQAHRWQDLASWEAKGGLELRGRTIGIVGYGAIGSEIGRLAAAFGMDVLAVRRHPGHTRSSPGGMLPGTGDLTAAIPRRVSGPGQLRDMLPECDVIVLTVPLTPETVGLIGAQEIAAMKPRANLVNVARGQVVDESALHRTLQRGQLQGAVLDGFQEEPLPSDSPFWDLPNVLVTPHVAPNSSVYNDRATDLFAENLRRFLNGKPMLNEFDRARGY
jgi:phosphoglycerate dehydrogenase-like enzyme